MRPVLVSRVIPAGRDPLDTAYVIGEAPPDAVLVNEYAVPTVPVKPELGEVKVIGVTIAKVSGDM